MSNSLKNRISVKLNKPIVNLFVYIYILKKLFLDYKFSNGDRIVYIIHTLGFKRKNQNKQISIVHISRCIITKILKSKGNSRD